MHCYCQNIPARPPLQGFTVVIVKNWSEITEENFERWIALYGDAFTNPSYREKLRLHYWLERCHQASGSYFL